VLDGKAESDIGLFIIKTMRRRSASAAPHSSAPAATAASGLGSRAGSTGTAAFAQPGR